MGNNKSHSSLLNIEEKPYLSNTSWTLHHATFKGQPDRKVSLFKSTQSEKPSTLEKCAKNLMLHRHPNILKYVASWTAGGTLFLATEEVTPLAHVITKQTPLQICIGLQSVLKAVNFLHVKALSSHNNICQTSVYVTPEGYWKLGGLEYLCRFSDLSARFLADSHQGRYERGISPNEESRIPQPPSAIDQYAFGILTEEVLKSREEDVPGMADFLQVAIAQLQAVDCKLRPSIETLLEHSFFTHQFITIHNFLTELPLKSSNQKQTFFRDLSSSLSEFNGEAVASQLGGLLLSRIVMLDPTAQQHLLPRVLTPKSCDDSVGLFAEQTYRDHIAPRLMSIFHVRDIQVRLTLLKYFSMFCDMFTIPQLNSHIIPELLVGVMDMNDELVAATLRALADLVPILGASTVIGGKRAKHFSDGRPKINPVSKAGRKSNKAVKTHEIDVGVGFCETAPAGKTDYPELFLSERPSPDGGEAPTSSTPVTTEDEGEAWDSWDNLPPPFNQMDSELDVNPIITADMNESKLIVEDLLVSPLPTTSRPPISKVPSDPPLNIPIDKLETLDIKTTVEPSSSELDFFRDMEPVISKTQVVRVGTPSPRHSRRPLEGAPSTSIFDAAVHDTDEVGWGDDSDWADEGVDNELSAVNLQD